MAGFIAAQRAEYGVPHALACRALGVSQAWFYKWRHGDGSPRRARRRALSALVAALFARHRGTYGAPRITADLQEMGWRVSQNTIAVIMAEQGLRARAKRRRRGTTRPGKGRWRAPDLVKRDFTARRVNQRWFGDGTEIDTAEGKPHLARGLYVCSRRIVGFASERAPRRRAGLRLVGDGGRGARGQVGGVEPPLRPRCNTRIQAVVATPRYGGEQWGDHRGGWRRRRGVRRCVRPVVRGCGGGSICGGSGRRSRGE